MEHLVEFLRSTRNPLLRSSLRLRLIDDVGETTLEFNRTILAAAFVFFEKLVDFELAKGGNCESTVDFVVPCRLIAAELLGFAETGVPKLDRPAGLPLSGRRNFEEYSEIVRLCDDWGFRLAWTPLFEEFATLVPRHTRGGDYVRISQILLRAADALAATDDSAGRRCRDLVCRAVWREAPAGGCRPLPAAVEEWGASSGLRRGGRTTVYYVDEWQLCTYAHRSDSGGERTGEATSKVELTKEKLLGCDDGRTAETVAEMFAAPMFGALVAGERIFAYTKKSWGVWSRETRKLLAFGDFARLKFGNFGDRPPQEIAFNGERFGYRLAGNVYLTKLDLDSASGAHRVEPPCTGSFFAPHYTNKVCFSADLQGFAIRTPRGIVVHRNGRERVVKTDSEWFWYEGNVFRYSNGDFVMYEEMSDACPTTREYFRRRTAGDCDIELRFRPVVNGVHGHLEVRHGRCHPGLKYDASFKESRDYISDMLPAFLGAKFSPYGDSLVFATARGVFVYDYLRNEAVVLRTASYNVEFALGE